MDAWNSHASILVLWYYYCGWLTVEYEKLNKTISYLEEFMKNYKFDSDIKDFYHTLILLKKKLPTLKELEELEKDEINIEMKYDELCELNYYFDPSCVIIRKKIHDNYVKKLRDENRLKRLQKKINVTLK